MSAMLMDPEAVQGFLALALGLAGAGVLATGFEAFTQRAASFALLETGGTQALASVPLVVFSAPYIILRNTVRGRRFERRRIGFVAAATVIACLWGLASGRVLLDCTLALVG